MNAMSYAVDLAARLIRCESVTPIEGGALLLLADELRTLGFECFWLPFGEGTSRIENLFARRGNGAPHFAFAGHTDVVPAGDIATWHYDPFSGTISSGKLFGRGAVDMKGAIAAFVAAVSEFIAYSPQGSISLIITGDEEGDAEFGTVKVVDWMIANKHIPDICIVGEPTSANLLGDTIKNGRRGSLSCALRVNGVQGHVAYPNLADNPIVNLLAMLAPVNGISLDDGNEYFDPSTAHVTTIDTNNPTSNVIPDKISARFNIRFNTEHQADHLIIWLKEHFDKVSNSWQADWHISAHPFLTPSGQLTDLMKDSIFEVTGISPKLSTGGGTSDARFITNVCPVAEFGLVGQTMHKVNEHVLIDDINKLTAIYLAMLSRFFEVTK